MFPVLEPMNSLIPQTRCLSSFAEFAVIVVCCAEVARMVYDTLLVQQIKFGVQGIQRSGHRICIGHIHDGGHTTCGSRTAFGEDVRFVGQPGSRNVHGRR